MKRILLYLRAIVEGTIAFWLLILLPFLAVDMIRGRAPITVLLVSLLAICLLFMAAILLFRDAVRLWIRLKIPTTS
jgi:threonine/homoserine/homoserine lactone efflux protein